MQANTLEYRLEKMEGEVSSILDKVNGEPRNARAFVISVVAIGLSVIGALFAFGNWVISTKLAPMEVQIEYQYEAIKRIETKIDRLTSSKK